MTYDTNLLDRCAQPRISYTPAVNKTILKVSHFATRQKNMRRKLLQLKKKKHKLVSLAAFSQEMMMKKGRRVNYC